MHKLFFRQRTIAASMYISGVTGVNDVLNRDG